MGLAAASERCIRPAGFAAIPEVQVTAVGGADTCDGCRISGQRPLPTGEVAVRRFGGGKTREQGVQQPLRGKRIEAECGVAGGRDSPMRGVGAIRRSMRATRRVGARFNAAVAPAGPLPMMRTSTSSM